MRATTRGGATWRGRGAWTSLVFWSHPRPPPPPSPTTQTPVSAEVALIAHKNSPNTHPQLKQIISYYRNHQNCQTLLSRTLAWFSYSLSWPFNLVHMCCPYSLIATLSMLSIRSLIVMMTSILSTSQPLVLIDWVKNEEQLVEWLYERQQKLATCPICLSVCLSLTTNSSKKQTILLLFSLYSASLSRLVYPSLLILPTKKGHPHKLSSSQLLFPVLFLDCCDEFASISVSCSFRRKLDLFLSRDSSSLLKFHTLSVVIPSHSSTHANFNLTQPSFSFDCICSFHFSQFCDVPGQVLDQRLRWPFCGFVTRLAFCAMCFGAPTAFLNSIRAINRLFL